MKHIFILVFTLLISAISVAQDKTTIEAKSSDISDNLDLEAVASAFGESKDLEDFEKKLNDPDLQLSNLDLNNDGQVDYLRVVSDSDKSSRVVMIQAVIGKDEFQDVATIEVEKDTSGTTKVQVVGDVYMYGPNYIIEPVYVRPPIIFTWFWGPLFRPWYSPWYWGYYPPFFHPWRPFPPYVYRQNVHVHINVNHTYHYTNVRRNTNVNMRRDLSRNDYASRNPQQSFNRRNEGVTNRRDLTRTRENTNTANRRDIPNTNRNVNPDWQPRSSGSNVRNNRATVTTPGRGSSTRPSTLPSTSHQTRPSTRPQTTMPSTRPSTRPSTSYPSMNNRRTQPMQMPSRNMPRRGRG
ncbi:hypothetical protein [Robertkochia solimangrovi]|uniref:hypothetical protein n=1 Tax=Robertkochia solimangrovi TaxID=2213046 RepID=UPI0013A59066|nr:hypothetical protein [Robertkochia solimangrovi]